MIVCDQNNMANSVLANITVLDSLSYPSMSLVLSVSSNSLGVNNSKSSCTCLTDLTHLLDNLAVQQETKIRQCGKFLQMVFWGRYLECWIKGFSLPVVVVTPNKRLTVTVSHSLLAVLRQDFSRRCCAHQWAACPGMTQCLPSTNGWCAQHEGTNFVQAHSVWCVRKKFLKIANGEIKDSSQKSSSPCW